MTAEELLKNAETFEYSNIIEIDGRSRAINIPLGEEFFGVEGDVKVERKYFSCPKVVGDNIDLSECNIYINYVLADKEGNPKSEDVESYFCDDLSDDGDNIKFTWLLSARVLAEDGFIAFAVVAKKSVDGILENKWNTTPGIGIVKKTIKDGKEIQQKYPDVIDNLMNRVHELETIIESGGAGGGSVTSVNGQTGVVNIPIPSKTSDLENDKGFITRLVADLENYYLKSETYTKDEVKALISSIPKFSIKPVESLPTTDISTTTVYLLKSGNETDNIFTEYIYVDGAWEYLGKQTIDLSGYAKKATTLEGYGITDGATKQAVQELQETIDDYSVFVTPQMFGAKGDENTDDTVAMQNAFNHVAKNGGYLFIPKGRYKVTSPITVDWSSTSTTKRNFLQKIIGAGSQAFEKYYDNSVIVGYNIPANRGVIELLGNGNTWGTETRIEDLGIECDEATCDTMSFALKYGDARNFKLSRVKLRGYNGILSRCGSIVDENGNSTTKGYEQMDIKFEQCDIYTFPSSTKGFAFLPEGVVTEHYAVMDNIVVDSCLINGVWVVNSVNVLFQSCHIAINNVANKEITKNNVGLLNGYEIDYATGFYIAQAMSCVFQNCYFEDYRRGIQITPTIGNIRNVSIMNCYLNPGCNQFNSDGSRLCADYGIRINSGMSGKVVRNVLVQNNVFRFIEGDTEYVKANVSNEFANRFVFRDNCTTNTQVVPKVINTTTDGYDICNDINEGSSIKNMESSDDGKTITIYLTNGKNYTLKSSTPIKGVDYFTEAEIEEITENASVLAKAELQQIAPPTWVESVADMTDTTKNYVLLSSGNIWAYMKKTKTVAGETIPNFTNLIDGTNGYIKEGQRYSLSGKGFRDYTTVPNFASIVIPVPTSGSLTVRVRGMEYNTSYPAIYGGTTNSAFDSAMGNQGSTDTKDDNGDWIFTVNNTYNVSYIITSGVLTTDADKVICTVNEELTYTEIPSTTETVTEWTDTGHNIVQS